MGSRGSFLESGGFSTPARWHTVDYVDGKALHVHYYTDGVRGKHPDILHPGSTLYEKYKTLFKGVK